jgi:hypothetical protein
MTSTEFDQIVRRLDAAIAYQVQYSTALAADDVLMRANMLAHKDAILNPPPCVKRVPNWGF